MINGNYFDPQHRALGLIVADGAQTAIRLPALPVGFRYTDLAATGEHLVAPWEEVRFTDVGAAGVLFYRLSGSR